ncbi:ionotropic receptor 75a-like [Sabethes cyaneus]|uniref:ionotropic receptor 75a-like n=1 Tax=Sabethes cyaneus TaxID=53552 RepID=UPI00237D50F9|nr:ionotropic receptor 75a-like [Sabethes cyaneus]
MKPLFALYFLLHTVTAVLNVQLLEDYLNWQRLKTVVIFHCLDQSDEINHVSVRMSHAFGGRIYYEDISNFSIGLWNHSHVMRIDYQKLGVTIDTTCANTVDLFRVISAHEYFNASYHWLIFGNESTKCVLNEQNLNIDAKVTLVITAEESGESYDVYDVFSPMRRRGMPLNVTYMGNWSTHWGLNIVVHQTEYERRFDFGGLWLKTAVTPLNLLHHSTLLEQLDSNGTVEQYSLHRFGYRIMQVVMFKHNFTLKMIRTSSWFLENTDGRSNKGTIGQVATKQCDFFINPLSLRQDRVAPFDQTIVIAVAKMLFVFRHPKKSQARNIFLQPFRIDLWIGVLAVVVVTATILFVMFWTEIWKERYSYEIEDNRSLSLMIIFGILCQQGFAAKTYLSSSRIILISTLIFSVLILQFYSTYIVGYLLITPPKFMNTLKHLLDSDLKILIEDIAYNADYLKTTKDPVAIELNNRKIRNEVNNFVNVTEGIARVKQGGYAFQCDTAYAYPLVKATFTDKEICDLQEVYLNPIRLMQIPLRKGSPFTEMFRITFCKTVETAITRYHQKRFFSDKPKCAKDERETKAVHFNDVSTLFVGFTGMIFAVLLTESASRWASKVCDCV